MLPWWFSPVAPSVLLPYAPSLLPCTFLYPLAPPDYSIAALSKAGAAPFTDPEGQSLIISPGCIYCIYTVMDPWKVQTARAGNIHQVSANIMGDGLEKNCSFARKQSRQLCRYGVHVCLV